MTGSQTPNGAVDQLFYFQGQERDPTTRLQQHGARWYDPDTGRWLSEDPLGFDGGDPNLYRFVGNSPTTYVDPTGTTQAGNPLASLNVSNGGYSGGKAAGPRIPNSAVASGFKAIGNSFLSAGTSLVNNVYSAGRNLANNYNEISRLYSQANTLTGQINAVANQRANPGWFGPSSSALNDQYNTLASQRLAVNANIENIITTSVFGGPRAELVSNPGGTQYNSVAGYAARGLGTGAKAVTNAAVSTATIGYVNEAWTVNDFDRRIAAYDTAHGFALVGTEIGGALITGGASRYARSGTALARLGKAAVAYDTAGNVVGVGRGVNDAYNSGLGFSNSVQIIGSGLGLGGNVAAGGRALQEIASDVTRLRAQPAGLYSGVPIKASLTSTISEFDVRPYCDFSKFAGDGLEGHEVLQNAVLQRNGWGASRGSNPAIALAQRPGLHGIVTDAQRANGMFTNDYLNNVTRVGNIRDNLNILRSVGVPEATVQVIRRDAVSFARGLRQ